MHAEIGRGETIWKTTTWKTEKETEGQIKMRLRDMVAGQQMARTGSEQTLWQALVLVELKFPVLLPEC
jgi:hypothetical protein